MKCFLFICLHLRRSLFITGSIIAVLGINNSCIGAKAITVVWLTKEQKEGLTPEMIKHQAKHAVETALINAYAKEHPLPNVAQYKKEHEQKESCTDRDVIVKKMAFLIANERVKKLTIDELRDYYDKIVKDWKQSGGHPRRKNYETGVFTWLGDELESGKFPPFSESPVLLANIKRVLRATWQRAEEYGPLGEGRFDNDQGLPKLRQHPKYKEALAVCEKEYQISSESVPNSSALFIMFREQARQQIENMTDQQVREYYEKHPSEFSGYPFEDDNGKRVPFEKLDMEYMHRHMTSPLSEALKRDFMRKLANDYTIKSDSSEIAAAVKDFQA